jgi:hypothetical protein
MNALHLSTTLKTLTLTAALCTAGTASANIITTFDTGLQGWTGVGGTISHAAGGYLLQQDSLNTWMSVVAPAAYHGNLSAYLGGTLSFDGLNANGAVADLASAPWFGRVTVSGPGGSAWRDLTGLGQGQPPVNGAWQTYATTLDVAGWDGNLAGALADVTSMTVTLEFSNSIVEVAGFDNFRVSAVPSGETPPNSVPEPGPLALLALAAGGAALASRRRTPARRSA